jgi:protein arginine N-methyltransferase 1
MYRLTDYGAMVRDKRRIDAYRRALSAVITANTTILDLGSGLGTFSVIAAKLGARVYAIESANIMTLAEEIARANGVADRISFIRGRSTAIDLPEQVDVIVSDLGNALPLFEEHLPSLADARTRFLKPGGVLIPRNARLMCAPVSNAELYARITEPWHSVAEVDLSAAERIALQSPHALAVTPNDLAGDPRVWSELDYATVTSPDVSGSAEWTIDRTVHGIALWFETTLHDDIHFASGPWSEGSVHATMVLPLLQPLDGRTLHVAIDATLINGRYVVSWHARTDTSAGVLQCTEPRANRIAREISFRPSARVVARRVAHELLLLDPATGLYHVLNESGARIWALLQDGANVTSIAAAMASEFEVELSRAIEDVTAILTELRHANLIEAAS